MTEKPAVADTTAEQLSATPLTPVILQPETPAAEAPPVAAAPEPLDPKFLETVLKVMKLDPVGRWLATEQLYANRDNIKAGTEAGTLNDVGMETYYTLTGLIIEPNLKRQLREVTGELSAELLGVITADVRAKAKKKIIGSGTLSPERMRKKIAELRTMTFNDMKGWEQIHTLPVWSSDKAPTATEALRLRMNEADPALLVEICTNVARLVGMSATLNEKLENLGPAVVAAEKAWKLISEGAEAEGFIKGLQTTADAANAAYTAAQPAEGAAPDKKKNQELLGLKAKVDTAQKALDAAQAAKQALDKAKEDQEKLPKQAERPKAFFKIFDPIAASALETHAAKKGLKVPNRNPQDMGKYTAAERWQLLGQKAQAAVHAASMEAARQAAAVKPATETAVVVAANAKPSASLGSIALTLVGKGWLWNKQK